LMKDGVPIHRSKIAKEWLDDNGVEKTVWHAQSPDINPIKSLCRVNSSQACFVKTLSK
jgi:hypothetical protein